LPSEGLKTFTHLERLRGQHNPAAPISRKRRVEGFWSNNSGPSLTFTYLSRQNLWWT